MLTYLINIEILIKFFVNIIINFYKLIKSRKWFINLKLIRYITFYKNLFIKLFNYNKIIKFKNKNKLSIINKNIINIFFK